MKFLDKKFQSRFSATFCPPVKLEVRHILLICIGIFSLLFRVFLVGVLLSELLADMF